MDAKARIMTCRLLVYAEQNPQYSERCGIKDVSYYKSSCAVNEVPSAEEDIKDEVVGRIQNG